MGYYNKVILVGNLTRDPELRYTPKGTAIAKLGLAVNRTWKDEAGNSKEEVTFVDVEAFGRPAETIGQYLKKGRPVLVEGRLRQDTWEDKQTSQKRSKLMVVLESFQFMDSGGRSSEEGGVPGVPRTAPAAAAAPASPPPPAPRPHDEPAQEEDDVPF